MMSRLVFCLYFLLAGGLPAQTSGNVFTLPEKPGSLVSDSARWLNEQELRDWEKRLELWKNEEGVEVYLVILPSLHGTPPEHVVREVAQRWQTTKLCGVVLVVPGDGGPWLWWQGEVMDAIQLKPSAHREMILRMEKKARSEANDLDRLKSALHQLGDTLRVVHAQWKQTNFLRDKWNDSIYERWSKERLQRRSKWISVGTAAFFALLILVWILRRCWLRLRRYFFPRVTAQRRFGAPYAGGSGAIITIPSSKSHP